MPSPFLKVFSTILLFLSINAFAQAQDITICTWKNNAKAALSYTWDDNTGKQLSTAMPIFDKYGYKMTFFLTTNWGPDWTGFKKAFDNGHEIAVHTLSHPNFGSIDDAAEEKEQADCQKLIREKISPLAANTMAYPFCASGNKTITSKYFIAARGCNGQVEKKTPPDYYNTGSLICGTDGGVNSSTAFNNAATNAASTEGWAIFLLHGIDSDGGYSPVTSQMMDQHLSFVKNAGSDYFLDTYEAVARYARSRTGAIVDQYSSSLSKISFEVKNEGITSSHSDSISIIWKNEAVWEEFVITQAGNVLTSRLLGGNRHIFEAIPNGGKIEISKGSTTSTSMLKTLDIQFYVQGNTLNISNNTVASLESKIYDVTGKLLLNKIIENSQEFIDLSTISSGRYFIHFTSRSGAMSGSFMKP